MDQSKLMKQLRDSGRLALAEDKNDVLWASNSYWAVPIRDRKNHPIAQALQRYNLAVEPSYLDVFESIRPSERDVPDIEKVVALSREDRIVLTPEKVGSFGVNIKVSEAFCSVFRRPDGNFVVLRNRYANFVQRITVMCVDGVWEQSAQELYKSIDSTLAQVAWVVEGEVRAIVMPIRCIEQAKVKAATPEASEKVSA